MCAGLVVTVTDGFKVSAPPEPPPIPEPSEEDLAAMALSQRDGLLAIAAIRIAPLQDAVDLGEATDAEVSLLTEWKVYRVALNRLPEQAGYPNEIDWPVQPS
ncbi:tail fiber assembly protein [Pseudomonas mosselii]|nr:tail fiber assembly protein [Pseudomonas mosselii]